MRGLSQHFHSGCDGRRNGRGVGDRPPCGWPVGRGVNRTGLRSDPTRTHRRCGYVGSDGIPANRFDRRRDCARFSDTLYGAVLSLDGFTIKDTNVTEIRPERRWYLRVQALYSTGRTRRR